MQNSNLPAIKTLVRAEFLYNQKEGFDEYIEAWIIGCRAVKGRALTFYVMLENGVLFTGLPVHAFTVKKSKKINLSDACFWDCISNDIDVIEFEFLRRSACRVYMRDGSSVFGKYICSIDFVDRNSLQGLASTPDEWKILHLIQLDSGNFVLYPQNRIIFKDASLYSEVDKSQLRYKVNTTTWESESELSSQYNTDYLYSNGQKSKKLRNTGSKTR